MSTLTLTEISAAVDAVFDATLALAKPVRIAAQRISDTATVRTDIYTGPKGSGFVVVAALAENDQVFSVSKQHGPETWREHNWDRKAMRDALEADYNAQVAEGIIVNGITLAAQESDCAKFSQLAILLREAEELQPDEAAKAAFRASPVTLVDIHDVVHVVTVTEARQLIVQYGQMVAALWAEFAKQRAALNL